MPADNRCIESIKRMRKTPVEETELQNENLIESLINSA
jgi:hypothetical protein